jgi:hypothetical protein
MVMANIPGEFILTPNPFILPSGLSVKLVYHEGPENAFPSCPLWVKKPCRLNTPAGLSGRLIFGRLFLRKPNF